MKLFVRDTIDGLLREAGSSLPDDGTDRIDEKPRGGERRQAVNVGGRIELDEVESRDPRPLAEAGDQVDHFSIGEATRGTRRHTRHDAGIDAVAIKCDDDLRS